MRLGDPTADFQESYSAARGWRDQLRTRQQGRLEGLVRRADIRVAVLRFPLVFERNPARTIKVIFLQDVVFQLPHDFLEDAHIILYHSRVSRCAPVFGHFVNILMRQQCKHEAPASESLPLSRLTRWRFVLVF